MPNWEQRRLKAEATARFRAEMKDPKRPRTPSPARKVRSRKKKAG
jgi:hypothetical protein